MSNIKINKGIITDLYVNRKMSISKIAKHIGVQWESARKALHRFGISVRPRGSNPRIIISGEDLRRFYVGEKKSARDIARLIGCGETIINRKLHQFNIPMRHTSEYLKGRPFSLQHRSRLSKAKSGQWIGETNPNWKGGITVDGLYIRRHMEYQRFRRNVLRLKGDKCYHCKKNLLEPCHACSRPFHRHVHHLRPFSIFPKLRTDIDNTVVLCETCHKTIHNT